MLALLKLWRNLTDIKQPKELFCDAYSSFISTTSEEICDTIENICFFHDCSDTAQQCRDDSATDQGYDHAAVHIDDNFENLDLPSHPEEEQSGEFESLISEEDIQQVLD
jgi:hypothetical protein